MQLHQEAGNKQDIIAIRTFEKEISETLCNLFITPYTDVHVLSVYSDLTKRLLAYKVLNRSELFHEDSWLNSGFNRIISVDFNPSFKLLPRKFVPEGSEGHLALDNEVVIDCPLIPGRIHYSRGLLKYQAAHPHDAVYVYRHEGHYSIFLFKGADCVFANSFKCENELEVLYFIVNALAINDMQQEKTALYIDYDLLSDKSLTRLLQPYFLSFGAARLEHEDIDPLIPNLPEMLFTNHLLSLCV